MASRLGTFGELDPNDAHNRIITDIQLAPRNANGKVEYVASFFLVKPIDLSKSSRLMWHDVPNRGGRLTIVEAERLLQRRAAAHVDGGQWQHFVSHGGADVPQLRRDRGEVLQGLDGLRIERRAAPGRPEGLS